MDILSLYKVDRHMGMIAMSSYPVICIAVTLYSLCGIGIQKQQVNEYGEYVQVFILSDKMCITRSVTLYKQIREKRI